MSRTTEDARIAEPLLAADHSELVNPASFHDALFPDPFSQEELDFWSRYFCLATFDTSEEAGQHAFRYIRRLYIPEAAAIPVFVLMGYAGKTSYIHALSMPWAVFVNRAQLMIGFETLRPCWQAHPSTIPIRANMRTIPAQIFGHELPMSQLDFAFASNASSAWSLWACSGLLGGVLKRWSDDSSYSALRWSAEFELIPFPVAFAVVTGIGWAVSVGLVGCAHMRKDFSIQFHSIAAGTPYAAPPTLTADGTHARLTTLCSLSDTTNFPVLAEVIHRHAAALADGIPVAGALLGGGRSIDEDENLDEVLTSHFGSDVATQYVKDLAADKALHARNRRYLVTTVVMLGTSLYFQITWFMIQREKASWVDLGTALLTIITSLKTLVERSWVQWQLFNAVRKVTASDNFIAQQMLRYGRCHYVVLGELGCPLLIGVILTMVNLYRFVMSFGCHSHIFVIFDGCWTP